jgi:UDP-glucose:glycoprotein glucosyltransferase
VSELGLQTSQVILDSSNPLTTLITLSQNFPSFAEKLSAVNVTAETLGSVQSNQQVIEGGRNHLWLNGINIKSKDFTPLR